MAHSQLQLAEVAPNVKEAVATTVKEETLRRLIILQLPAAVVVAATLIMDNLEAQVVAVVMLDMDIATVAVMLAAKDMMAEIMAKAGAEEAVAVQAAMLVLRIVHNMAAVVDQVQFQDRLYHAVAVEAAVAAHEAAVVDQVVAAVARVVIHLSKDKQDRATMVAAVAV
jgi:hypothetical protein